VLSFPRRSASAPWLVSPAAPLLVKIRRFFCVPARGLVRPLTAFDRVRSVDFALALVAVCAVWTSASVRARSQQVASSHHSRRYLEPLFAAIHHAFFQAELVLLA